MQALPQGWPDDADVETAPELFLEFASAAWPPASDGVPAGTAELGSWSVDRSLTGSSLPGQVRGAAGFSIATGSATFAQPLGEQLSPFAKGDRRLGARGACVLYASHTGAAGSGRLPLGKFVLAPIAGAGLSADVALDLEENSINLKRPIAIRWRRNEVIASRFEIDPSWVLDKIARSAGYFQTPNVRSGTLLSLPLVGGTMAEAGETTSATIGGWSEHAGDVGMGPGGLVIAEIPDGYGGPAAIHVTAEVAGTGGEVVLAGLWLNFRGDHVIITHGMVVQQIMYPAGANLGLARIRVSIQDPFSSAPTIRVYSSETLASEPLVMSLASAAIDTANRAIAVRTDRAPTGRFIRGVMVDTTFRDDWAFTPNAKINLSGSPLHAAFDALTGFGWDMAQKIAAATLGAVWVSESGVFTYRNRSSLRGGDIVDEVEALDKLEDLPWVIDPGEIADRVELSYTPTQVVQSVNSTTIWEATEAIRIGPRQTITLVVEVAGAVNAPSAFRPVWDETYEPHQMSRWAAAFSADGSGERPQSSDLVVTARMVSVSTAEIRLTSRTDVTLWAVDGNGSPCLILRTSLQVLPGEPLTISSGLAESTALNPLSIDCGSWVQDSETAQSLLAWVTGQTSHAQAVVPSVRVKPELRRQIGDIVRLTDGKSGLITKALITAVSLAGNGGTYTQHLDFALLDLTWADYDKWLQAHGIDTFAQLDTYMQAHNIDTFDAFDEWGRDFGGTL